MTTIEIPALRVGQMVIKLVGDSPLISHRWSEKAKRQMLDKMMRNAAMRKEPKDPEAEFAASLYPYPDGGYGFPSIAFKAAAVSACRSVAAIKMTEARAAFHIPGELVKLDGDPTPREDMVRVGMTTDIRYRAEFWPWSTTFLLTYNQSAISPSQIANLLNVAGFGTGVGDWRPEKDGRNGMFHVATQEEA